MSTPLGSPLARRLSQRNRLAARDCPRPKRGAIVRCGSSSDWRLEDRCLLSGEPFPKPTVTSIDQVFYNGITPQYEKQITIYNNSPTQTIYAFLEGANNLQAQAPYNGTAALDPFDPINHEFRGYIGYKDGVTDTAGLPPNSSITITVPFVFWDSGRIIFSTDGPDQFNTHGGAASGNGPGAPFYYHDATNTAFYYANVSSSNPGQLVFTPIYNSFSPAGDHKPVTDNWKSPVATGQFPDKQVFEVIGPGLPGGRAFVTIDATHPGYINLPQVGIHQPTANQYTFIAVKSDGHGGFLPDPVFTTARFIQTGFSFTSGNKQNHDGEVMWYHALRAEVPNNDAPYQLTEVTFRSAFYDKKVNTAANFQPLLTDKQYVDAINNAVDYDVSYVDATNMPIAMEATDAPIPNVKPTTKAPYGWVGSSQSLKDFDKALAAFTSTNQGDANTNFLGKYFSDPNHPGGRGYPSYVIVQDGNVKLPAGQNIFLASPLGTAGVADIQFFKQFDDKTVIRAPLFALTSGGSGPSVLTLNSTDTSIVKGTALGLNVAPDANNYALTQLIGKDPTTYVVRDATKNIALGPVKELDYKDVNGQKVLVGVTLKNTIPDGVSNKDVFDFTLDQTDYAASRIASLWYSWAQYYIQHVKAKTQTASGKVNATGETVRLDQPAEDLVPGMDVTPGPGVPAGCVVLAVGPDKQTITLSEKVTGTKFEFKAPTFASLVGYDPKFTPTVSLTFPNHGAAVPYNTAAFAEKFAETVFTVMNAFGISAKGKPNAWLPLLGNIIGGNQGPDYLPHANDQIRFVLTNELKSALRGVPDYVSPLYSDPAQWYPDPALHTGGQDYNVFNLDPVVWFIHDKLGLSSVYAFANDDDVGNVNGFGANSLSIAVGGLNGLPNKDPYTLQNPFGVVQAKSATTQNLSSLLGGLSDANNPGPVNNAAVPEMVSQYNYNDHIFGSMINGNGVPAGTSIQFLNKNQDPTLTTIQITAPISHPSTSTTYTFFSPMTFTATALDSRYGANTLVINSPDAFNTLKKLGPPGNIQVTGEGIAQGSKVMIDHFDDSGGVLKVVLTSPLDRKLVTTPGEYYGYTFGSPATPLVRDGGFEWDNVAKLTDGIYYGPGLSSATKDWKFIDSGPDDRTGGQNTGPYAGIAYSNTSRFTKGNPLPPQGLQVGFVQATSRILQVVTLPAGTFNLAFLAAQSGANKDGEAQTLEVFVDNVLKGRITPKSTTYEPETIQFTVPAGQHTIKFAGTVTSNPAPSSPTVLIDAVALNLTTPTLGRPTAAPRIAVIPGSVVTQGASFHEAGFVLGGTRGPLRTTVNYGDGSAVQPLVMGPNGSFVLAHTYTHPGTFVVTISAIDSSGRRDTEDFTVTATAPRSRIAAGRNAFIAALYRENLGRVPSSSALQLWSQRLAAGATLRNVARKIWASPEHQTLVSQGIVPPITFRHTLIDALRDRRRAVRTYRRGPGGPLTLVVQPPTS